MRGSSFLMAAALAASLAACSGTMGGTNFSGIPPMPQQAQDSSQRLAQYPADPPVAMHLNPVPASPYDSPDFVVPPYEIQ